MTGRGDTSIVGFIGGRDGKAWWGVKVGSTRAACSIQSTSDCGRLLVGLMVSSSGRSHAADSEVVGEKRSKRGQALDCLLEQVLDAQESSHTRDVVCLEGAEAGLRKD